MKETPGAVTFEGSPLTLVGEGIDIGAKVPEITLIDNDLKPVKLSTYRGKVVILATVPSLDTPVCDAETRRFNQEAANLGDDVVILTVSRDLPFAQKRWCGAAGIDRVVTLSDYNQRELGTAFGLTVKELGLLARAVIILDREGVVRSIQLVGEITDEPDYEEVISEAKSLL